MELTPRVLTEITDPQTGEVLFRRDGVWVFECSDDPRIDTKTQPHDATFVEYIFVEPCGAWRRVKTQGEANDYHGLYLFRVE